MYSPTLNILDCLCTCSNWLNIDCSPFLGDLPAVVVQSWPRTNILIAEVYVALNEKSSCFMLLSRGGEITETTHLITARKVPLSVSG